MSLVGRNAFERHQITVEKAKGHITVGAFLSFNLPVVGSILYCCESACHVPVR